MGDKAKKRNTFKERQTTTTITHDPDFLPARISNAGSNKNKRGEGKLFCPSSFYKIENLFIFEKALKI
jgi:hypothetical protein